VGLDGGVGTLLELADDPQVGESLVIGWIDGGRALQEIGRCIELAEVSETHRQVIERGGVPWIDGKESAVLLDGAAVISRLLVEDAETEPLEGGVRLFQARRSGLTLPREVCGDRRGRRERPAETLGRGPTLDRGAC
jgi:hypothetical protein